MHHVPCNLIAASHPVVVVDGFVSVNLDEVESAVGSQVLVHLCGGDHDGLALSEPAGGGFDDGEGFRQNLCQHLLVNVFDFFLESIDFVVYLLAFLDGCLFDGGFQPAYLRLLLADGLLQLVHERPTVRTELVVRQLVDMFVLCFNLFDYGLNGTHVFLCLVAE